ncbi:MAG: hypothetical protein HQ475_12855 [SAR202 cluster bacterium]|nr:hypothetical protein [SAR202 cluster bacterium]
MGDAIKSIVRNITYGILFFALLILAVFTAVLWLISDFDGTGVEPIALAGISTAFGLFFLPGKPVHYLTDSQKGKVVWVGILFIVATLAFVFVAILLPPFKDMKPDNQIYQPLKFLNAFFVMIAFVTFSLAAGVLLWTLSTALPPLNRRRRVKKPRSPTFSPPY